MREEQQKCAPEGYARNSPNNIVGGGWVDGLAAGAGYGSAMQQQDCGSRQSAEGLLRVRIQQLSREADRLEALAKALPEELPHSADEALYDLLSRR